MRTSPRGCGRQRARPSVVAGQVAPGRALSADRLHRHQPGAAGGARRGLLEPQRHLSCRVHGRRVFVAWMDTRQHCREDGNPARRNRGRSGAGSDLRREIPAANQFGGKARRVQQGPILGPAHTHRERRLGYIPWNRQTEFGSCECLRRKTRQLDLETRPHTGYGEG